MRRRGSPAATPTIPSGPSPAADRQRTPRHPAGAAKRRPDGEDHEPGGGRAVLQPFVPGKRSPLLLQRRKHLRAPPTLVGEQVPDDVAQDAEGERGEEHQSASPRRPPPQPTRRNLPDRSDVGGRTSRAAMRRPRHPTPAEAVAPAIAVKALAPRDAGRSARPAGARGPRRSSRAARRGCASARSVSGRPRRNSGRSGAIAPIAIAAGTRGVRRNGSATTAWLGVKGMLRSDCRS